MRRNVSGSAAVPGGWRRLDKLGARLPLEATVPTEVASFGRSSGALRTRDGSLALLAVALVLACLTGSYTSLAAPAPYPTPLAARAPGGGLVYEGLPVPESIAAAGETDSFTLDIDAGQTITVAVDPDAGLQPAVELFDPGSTSIGTAASGAAGEDAVLQAVPASASGTYTVTVGGAGGTTGSYTVCVILNAVLEAEEHDGPSNDTLATAQDIDASFVALGGGLERGAVLSGTGALAWTEDFESGSLGPAWSTYSSDANGRIQVTGAEGTAAGAFALLMDRTPGGAYTLNEAVWTVDLSGFAQALLTFWHADVLDEVHTFAGDFVDHYDADGVAISDDGTNWHPIFDAPGQLSGVWQDYTIDLAAEATAAGMTLGPNFQIKFQQYDNYDLTTDGRGYDEISVWVPAPSEDWYGFTLSAGESATLVLTALTAGSVSLELYDGDASQLAAGTGGAANVDEFIEGFVAPSGGTCYARVTGNVPRYSLVVAHSSGFDVEPNDDLASAQDIGSAGAALGEVGGESDYYSFSVTAGATLDVVTGTPAGGAYEFVNGLDPAIELYDPTAALVAFDDNSLDGRNASLSHSAANTGVYTVRVYAAAGSGEYVLDASGSTGSPPPFEVTSTDPADGASAHYAPTMTVEFSGAVDLTTLDASDLTVDGSPAAGYSVVDGDTVVFDLPALAEGVLDVAIAAGCVTGLAGEPIQPYAGQITMLPPFRVIDSSIQQGDSLPPGDLTYVVQFNLDLDTTYLTEYDMTLSGPVSCRPDTLNYDPATRTLTLEFLNVPEGSYTIILYSGDGQFEDVLGYDLDGDTPAWPIPPNVSGNGTEGSYFSVDFDLDVVTAALPTPLSGKAPPGSLVYARGLRANVSPGGDTDTLTLDVDDGQTITVVVNSQGSLQPTVELRDPGSALIGSEAAGAPGDDVVLQMVATAGAGTYSITVGGAGGTTGPYTVRVILNAAVEAEGHNGPSNDTLAEAQDIDGSFLALGGGAERGAVLGKLRSQKGAPVAGEDFETGTLGPAWSTYTSDLDGRIRVRDDVTSAGGTYALFLDRDPDGPYTLIEAIWTADLSGLTEAFLSFWHAQWNDDEDAFAGDFVDHYNADGVAISDDGTNWHPVLNPPDVWSNVWQEFTFDLAAEAASAGMSLGSNFQIKFQQYGTFYMPFDGRGYDEISVWAPTEVDDWYSFSLSAGEPATIALTALTAGSLSLELYDDSGTLLATGSSGAANVGEYVGNLVPGTSGAYYARIGGCDAEYSLVVTRSAVFDIEPNDSPAGPQEIGGAGYVLGASASTAGLGRLFVYDADADEIREVDPVTGLVLNAFSAPVAEAAYSNLGLATTPTSILVGGASTDPVYELDPDTGAMLRVLPNPGIGVTGIAFLNEEIFLLASFPDGEITVLDYNTGAVKRVMNTSPASVSSGLGASLEALFGTRRDALYLVDPLTAATTKLATLGGPLGKPGVGVIGDEVFVADVAVVHVYDLATLGLKRTLTGFSDAQAVGADVAPTNDSGDCYAFTVNAADNLMLATTTPGDGALEFTNSLDPAIELYDPLGALVASDDNGAPDGKNAELPHAAASTGVYTVRVYAAGGSGEYVLSVSGNTGSPPPFEVSSTDPADGALLSVAPTQMTVEFSEAVQLGTLDASDLTVDGVQATGYSVVDGDTIAFDLPALAEGVHDAAIAAGAVTSLGGTPVEAYAGQFALDLTAPRVISSSAQEGEVVPVGSLTYAVEFDEELDAAGLDETDFALVGATSGPHAPDSWSYDPVASTLTVDYSGLPEDSYTLTLLSGDGRFEDNAGWNLDGEPLSWPIPGNVSGDGAEGGDFVVNFAMDVGTVAYPTPLLAKLPPGSLIYDPSAAGIIAPAADTDSFTLEVDAGQTITVVVEPEAGLQPTAELFDPLSASLGSGTAAAAGEDAVLQTVAAAADGTYTVTVGSAGGTTGSFTVRVILNAAVEAEGHDGPSNDTLATAEDIDGSFISLGGSAERGAVLGALQAAPVVVFSEDFEAGLGGFTVDNTFGSGNGLWHLSTGRGSDPGHSPTASIYYGQNEGPAGGGDYDTLGTPNGGAVYSPLISLPASGELTLSFTYFLETEGSVFYDAAEVAVDDGLVTTVLSNSDGSMPETPGTWQTVTADLSSFAGSDITLRFSFDTMDSAVNMFEGWYVDDVTITAQVPGTPDFYAFGLNAGESATLALTALTGGGVSLEVYDGSATLLAVGAGGATNVSGFIEDFVASASDTYCARVTGTDSEYSLVVTRSASFDIEPNDDLAGARPIGSGEIVLGHVGEAVTERLFSLPLGGPSEVAELDPLTGAEINRFTAPAPTVGAVGLAFDGASLFFLDSGATLWELDPDTEAVLDSDAVVGGSGFYDGLAALGGKVYVLDYSADDILEFDPVSDTVTNVLSIVGWDLLGGMAGIRGPDALVAVAVPWILEIDPASGAVTGSFLVGVLYYGAAVMGGEIYLANDIVSIADVYSRSGTLLRTVDLGNATYALGGDDVASSDDADWYSFEVSAGDGLSIVTGTPAGGPFEFVNDLDPAIEFYDPVGALVAADDNSLDGRNASLSHSAGAAGTYTVRVYAAAGSGEYVLSVSGQTGGLPPFEVTSTDPADGAMLTFVPAQMTVDFSAAVQLETLEATDLKVDGVDATGYTVADGDTVVFDLAALGEGVHDVTIAAGAMTSLQGTPVEAYSAQFTVDMTAPGDVMSFTATPGDGQVTLAWVNPGDADFAGVLILRRTGGFPTGPGDPAAVVVYDGTDESFVDTGVVNGVTYYYGAFTYDAAPNYSPGVYDSATPGDTDPPGDVTGLALTSGDAQIELSWTNPADADFAGVLILRRTGSAPTGAPVDGMTYLPGNTIGDGTVVYAGAGADGTPGNASGWTDTGVVNGTTYYYLVFAFDEVPNYSAGAAGSCMAGLMITLGLPASVSEGDGVLAGAGTVTVSILQASDLVVGLSSGDLTELAVPSTVTVPANQPSATFDLTVVDDTEIDGTQTVTMTASATGWAEGSDTLDVLDDETMTLLLSLPASATEGDGVLAGQGTVSIPGTYASDVDVTLTSSDPLELIVSSPVTILAGETSATFDLTVVDDAEIDGAQAVAVMASAASWTSGLAAITILDNETRTFSVTLPASAAEDAGVLAGQGTVSISGTYASDLDIDLDSDDNTELMVPASVTILSGQTSATFDLVVVDDIAVDGTQTVMVTASAAGWIDGTDTMGVLDNDVILNVVGFAATAGDGEVQLGWTNPVDPNFIGVLILRKEGGYPTGPGDPGAVAIYDGAGTGCTDAGLTNGVAYYYGAFAHDAVPNYASGAFDSATPSDMTAPADVTGFTATAGDGEVQLSWANPGDPDFTGVRILRKEGGNPTGPNDPAATVVYDGAGTACTDGGLANGTTYYYGAFAHDAAPNYSAGAFDSATPSDMTPPGEVTGFAAAPGDGQVSLSWTNPSDPDFVGVKVLRKEGGFPSGPNDGAATVVYDGGAESLVDPGVTNGTTYYYAAYTYDGVPNYSPGAFDSATPSDTTPPADVTNFTATAGDGEVTLGWLNPADPGFVGVKILRKEGGFPLAPDDAAAVVVYDGNAESFIDTGLTNGTTYYYGAFAHDAVPNYAPGAFDSATPSDMTPPGNVTGFTATAGDGEVTLGWANPGDPDSAGVTILRKEGGFPSGPGDVGATVIYDGTDEAFVDAGLTNGTTYYYGAFAHDTVPNYAPGAFDSATPSDMTPPPDVMNFAATAGDGQVALDWLNPADPDFAGVTILRKEGGFPLGPGDAAATVIYDGSDEAFVDAGLTNGTTYYYGAFAHDAVPNYASGAFDSATPSDMTAPADVTGFAATAGDGEVQLSWANPGDPDFTGVRILRKEGGNPTGPNDAGATVVYDGAGTACTDGGLTNGTTYYYGAFAHDGVPNHASGAFDSATPSDMTAPGDAISLTATAGDGEVTLEWVNPADADFAGVLILQKTGGYPSGPADAGATVVYDGTDEAFVDSGLTNGVTYYYGAFSHDAVPNYAPGVFDSATPSDLTPPGDVTDFTAAAGDGEVTLAWVNPGDADLAGVTILRKEGSQPSGPGDPSAVVVYEGSDESFVDTGLTNGVTCYYGAFAHDAVPNHASGAFDSATPVASSAPEAPASIVIPSDDADGAYTVSWDASLDATSYELEEANNPSFDGATLVYDGPLTSVSVTGRPEGSYWYRVRAVNGAGSSCWSSGGPCRVERPANFTGGGCSGSGRLQEGIAPWLLPVVALCWMLLRIRRRRRGKGLRT